MAEHHRVNGRLGGLKILALKGPGYFSWLGKRGGRPTWEAAWERDKAKHAERLQALNRRQRGGAEQIEKIKGGSATQAIPLEQSPTVPPSVFISEA